MSPDQRPPRSLDGRLIALGVIVILIALPLLIDFFQRKADPFSGRGLEGNSLWILLAITLVAALILFAAVLRAGARLWMRRRHFRHGVFGSLWLTIYLASMISLLLWMGVGVLMIKGVERVWSDPTMQSVLTQGHSLAQAFAEQVESTTQRDARLVAAASEANVASLSPDRLGRHLRGLLERFDIDYLAVYEGNAFVHAVLDPDAGLGDLPEPGSAFLANVIADGEAVRMPPRQRGRLVIAGQRLADTDPATVILVGNVLEPRVVDQRRTLVEAYQGLRRIELDKKKWTILGYSLLAILGLVGPALTFVIARSVGEHFDRSVGALEKATERLARGDLEHRIDAESGDELGLLTARFNAMADELETRDQAVETAHRETQAERALAQAVNEGVAAGVIAIDDQSRITVLNRVARELLALGSGPILGHPIAEVLTDLGLDSLAEIATGPIEQRRSEIRATVGGRLKVFDVKLRELRDTEGHHTGRVMVLEDLTNLIQAKESGAWRDAARKVAHEIRNPLTPIQLSAERLKKKSLANDVDLPLAVTDAADTIVAEVQTMKRMVDEFSQYARLAPPSPKPTDIVDLIDSTARFYQDVMPGVSVTAIGDREIGSAVVDRDQIRRVLNNLVENAVDAAADAENQGIVTLSATTDGDALVLEVADNGIGLSDEQKSKMFLPHFSTKRRGSGLGLAIAERIISEHQGAIEVRDNQPRGTVVSLRLPRRI